MIVTIFRNRVRPEAMQEYLVWAKRMSELAESMPGYVSRKTFTAEDGERLTLVMFENEAAQLAWRTHPEHVEAQKKGRSHFYSEYSLLVCEPVRETNFLGAKRE
jgi:heme-degrading monooxygenase HmoA